MRCLNCGSENQPNATVCCRCGNPLTSAFNPAPAAEEAPEGANTSKATRVFTPEDLAAMSAGAKATRVFNSQDLATMSAGAKATRVFNPQELSRMIDQSGTADDSQLKETHVCPRCGNKIDPEAENCMFCGEQLKTTPSQPDTLEDSGQQPQKDDRKQEENEEGKIQHFDIPTSVTCPECGNEVPLEYTFCPKCGTRIPKNTIRVTRHQQEEEEQQIEEEVVPEVPVVKCTLTLIPEEGEQTAAVTQTYEGEEVVLNRNNTEPTNRTITSREQARITHEDGHWYVEDLSDMKSTFIHVGRKMEVQPGDVILLGNRCFTFGYEEPTATE